jgi:hypothetical protein
MAAVVETVDEDDDIPKLIDDDDDDNDNLFTLLPVDFALAGTMGNELETLDEVFQGSHVKEWQVAYDYEISQLGNLETWKTVDLPPEAKATLWSVMFKEKIGPDGNVEM